MCILVVCRLGMAKSTIRKRNRRLSKELFHNRQRFQITEPPSLVKPIRRKNYKEIVSWQPLCYRVSDCINVSDFKGLERIYLICMFMISESSERSISEGLILFIFAVSQVKRSA